MAVYTDVSDTELAAFLGAFELGGVLAFKGIAEGVENSNFFLKTERGSYILTLYEKRVREADLPFFLGLLSFRAVAAAAGCAAVRGAWRGAGAAAYGGRGIQAFAGVGVSCLV
jgi:homoserine kinase type II